MTRPIRRLLIANRAEIAVRVIRAARELGIESVAVCSEADTDAVHTRLADDHIVIGPAPAAKSYLDVDALLDAVTRSGADAIHPGYGFLAENADFAERVIAAGLTWVGPSPESIRAMGDKAAAREIAAAAGVPTVPGTPGPVADMAAGQAAAADIGYPLAIKAAAGGGGRGIRVVTDPADFADQFTLAQGEAQSAFGSGELYLERYISPVQHVEVQVFGDGENFIHLGERACSMQRRRQKVVEEAPAPGVAPDAREAMTAAAVALAREVGYLGAGTVEFLYDPASAEFFFIEMNTRIQVEHPVTELITGVDLVQEQLRVASGHALSVTQDDIAPRGHALEVRITAENPELKFFPSPGTLTEFTLPGGPFVRVDSGFEAGQTVTPYYDSLLAKIITWAPTRDQCLARMRRALGEVSVDGISTTAAFTRELIDIPEFRSGDYHTTTLETYLDQRGPATS